MNQDQEPNKDPLDDFFNVPAVVEEVAPPAVQKVQGALDEDFEIARTNIQEAVSLAQAAMTDLAGISKQMQQPRAYDALSKMLSAAVLANKALLEIHKNKQEVDEPVVQNINHTHNTLVMTTADMQKRLSEARKSLETD